jgi:hypothetical protein
MPSIYTVQLTPPSSCASRGSKGVCLASSSLYSAVSGPSNSTLACAQRDVDNYPAFRFAAGVRRTAADVSHELEHHGSSHRQLQGCGTRRVHVKKPRFPLIKKPPLAPFACEECKQPRVADRDWRSGALVPRFCSLVRGCWLLSTRSSCQGPDERLLYRDFPSYIISTLDNSTISGRKMIDRLRPLQLYIIAHCSPPNNMLTAALCPMRSVRARSRQDAP